MPALDDVWYGAGVLPGVTRALLAGPALLYGAVARVRDGLYGRGMLAEHAAPLPVLSVGNLSVGGTGKTPIAAWAAAALTKAGASPAVLLRGYGEDEPLVHARLNPTVPVVIDADRVRGARRARADGADCAVLDDGFQHRRLERAEDWVLVSAEQFPRSHRLLPAGPLREPVGALDRADVLIVTRKSASLDSALVLARELERYVPAERITVCSLAPSAVMDAASGRAQPLGVIAGARIVAATAIGAPDALFAQLRALGPAELDAVSWRDHHRFTDADVRALVQRARGRPVICTLKDAVKLAPLWPHDAPPLWYLSQRVEREHGAEVLDASLGRILAARAIGTSPAGATG